jgi:single-strand DNA-binding protein
MRNINRVVISGNLTRDPEWRGQQQTALALGVAVNDERKDPETGEWVEVPNFIDCVMFGNRARAVSQYLQRGTKVTVEGRLRWSSWEAQDGTKRSKVEVVVDEIEFSNRQSDTGGQRRQQEPAQQPAGGYVASPGVYQPSLASAPPAPQAEVYDEDIPF